jgi:hypothetical protein
MNHFWSGYVLQLLPVHIYFVMGKEYDCGHIAGIVKIPSISAKLREPEVGDVCE